ncbi:MAG: energy transducer TonB [Blastocatellia bacterium]
MSSVQEMLASDLDAELPGRPFAIWFSRLIGPKAGVVWQLAECGEPIVAPDKTWQDLPACAEANVNLPDGRKVFVVISVGTFKKGLTGKPAFFSAVVEHNEQLYQVRRLSVLPEMLRAPDALADYQPATNTTNRIVNLPVIKGYSARIIAPFHYLSSLSSRVPFVNDRLSPVEASPAAPTPPPTPPPTLPPTLMADLLEVPEKVPESELQGLAITRVKPVYPPSAKKMNAAGTVEVQITISEEGLVVEATAISGHFALRSAAVEAARKWVFKPAIFNGAPVKVKSVLTFVFAPSAK